MEFKFIDSNYINYMKLERIRSSAYDTNDFVSNRYLKQVLDKKILLVGAFFDNEFVAGAFISSENNSLYVEHLFVDIKYQHNKLHVGSNLLKFILNNKNKVEKYFDKVLEFSMLQTSTSLESFYEKLGYHASSNHMHMIKRI